MADTAPEVSAYLDTGERILWSGVPVRGIIFRAEDAYFLPFGIFWLGFNLLLAAAAFSSGSAPGGALIIFLPFLVIGFYLVPGRFLWDADVRGQTFYAITNRRAIIFRRVPWRRFETIGLMGATQISTIERRNGSGTILFGPRILGSAWNGWPGAGSDAFIFERIRDVKEAMRVVRSVQRGVK